MIHYFILTILLIVHSGNDGPKSMEHPISLVQTQPRSVIFPFDPNQSILVSLANLGCWLSVWRDIEGHSQVLLDFKEMKWGVAEQAPGWTEVLLCY